MSTTHTIKMTLNNDGTLKQPKLEPRWYQSEAVEAIRDSGERSQLLHFCGTGKSLTSFLATTDAEFVCVAAPTIALADQIAANWRSYGDTREHLAVHSQADERAITVGGGGLSLFTTHASLPDVAEQAAMLGLKADWLIVDEAHKIAGEHSERRHAALTTFPALRRLFMTATPRIATRSGKKVEALASMDDLELFGPVAHSYSYAAALDDGYVSPYEVCAIAADVDVDDDGERADAVLSALLRAVGSRGLRRVMSFHRRVDDAASFAAAVNAAGVGVRAFHTSGRDSLATQKATLAAFSSHDGPSLLTNARLFTEGIDVPSIDGVAFCSPKSSVVDIVQSVGRALRVDSANPGTATILAPVFIQDEDWDASTFSAVLQAMQAHDSQLTATMATPGAKAFSDGIATSDGFDDDERLMRILDGVDVVVVGDSSLAGTWDRRLAEYVDHVKMTGELPRPRTSLRTWLNTQRTNARKDELGPDRLAALRAHHLDPFKPTPSVFIHTGRRCTACGVIKPPAAFPLVDKGLRIASQCKKCGVEYNKARQFRAYLKQVVYDAGDLTHRQIKWIREARNHWRDGHLDLERVTLLIDAGFTPMPSSVDLCLGCLEELPISNFWKGRSKCKPCVEQIRLKNMETS